MPNIKVFDAGDTGLTPNDRGSSAMAQAGGTAASAGRIIAHEARVAGAAIGRGVTSVVDAAGELYQQSQDHDDTLAQTKASAASADFDLAQHQKLDSIMSPKADPDDPTGQKKITPDANDAPALIGQTLQEWQSDRASLRDTITNEKALKKFDQETMSSYKAFTHKAYAVSSELAYKAAGDNLTKTVRSYAGIVYSDPTQLEMALGKINSTISETAQQAPGLTAAQRAQFENEVKTTSSKAIIENAIEGMAKTPLGRKQAEELVNSGKYDAFIGTDRDKLLNHIRGQENAYKADLSAANTLKEKQEKDEALKATDEYVADAASPNPKKSAESIWTDPRYKGRPDLRQTAIGVMEKMREFAKKDTAVSPVLSRNTSMDLVKRIVAADGSEGKITDRSEIDKEFIAGNLTREDYKFALGQLKEMEKPEMKELAETRKDFFQSYKATIDPNELAGGSSLGRQNIYRAERDAIKMEQQLIKDGKDPNSLYDPASPNFFGNAGTLARYHTKMSDTLKFDQQLKEDLKGALAKYAPGAATMDNPSTAPSGTPLEIASKYLGASEHADHDALMPFLNSVKGNAGTLDPAKTAWCARYMNAVLGASGMQGTGLDTARSFVAPNAPGVAVAANQVQPGDIAVFPRGNNPAQGHVGFVKAVNKDGTIELLAGNQGDKVSVKTYKVADAVGFRRVTQANGFIPGPAGSALASSYMSGGEPVAQGKIPPPITNITNAAEGMKLPPGSKVRLPDGRIGTVPYPQVPMSR